MTLVIGIFVSVSAFAQDITVKGHIKDDLGEDVIGASVRVKDNPTVGTVSDINGNFTIKAKKGAALVVSFIGYATKEVAAASNVSVVLFEDAKVLNESVVIGYGTVKKNDLTGAVAAIKPDEMTKGITTSVQDMLSGKVPGVSVISNGGTPGGGAQIRIRGGASLSASSDPLIVIDGLIMDNDGVQGLSNGLAMVNPEDIETMTVLKDASSCAIYGARGAGGVIIITTKQGTKGKGAKISYTGNVGIATIAKKHEVLNGDEFREYAQELVNKGVVSPSALNALGTANTNWQDEIYRNAVTTDHQVSVAGATATTPYRFSVGYTDQNGIAKTSNFQRFTASANVDPSFLDDHLKFNLSLKYMYSTNKYVDGGVFGGSVACDPTQPIYDANYATTGGYWQNLWSGSSKDISGWNAPATNTNTPQNPVALYSLKNDRAKANVFIGKLGVTYKVHGFEDLTFNANVAGDYSEGIQDTDISPYSYSNNYYGWSGYQEAWKYNLMENFYANYSHNWNDIHDLSVTLGTEEQHLHRHIWEDGGGNWLGENINGVESTWKDHKNIEETKHTWINTIISGFGRLNYSLLDRYLLTASFRVDISNRFAPGHRTGYFPSAAFAWKVKNESFLRDVDLLNELKLRVSYGALGNENINKFYYCTRRYVDGDQFGQYAFGNNNYYTLRPEVYNDNLTWEKTTTFDVGVDYGFLNNRIEGGIDFYQRNTSGLLSEVPQASGINFGNYMFANIGELQNIGMEFNITARPVVTKDFMWQISYNVGWNKNKITHLNDAEGFLTGGSVSAGLNNRVMVNKVGYPTNSFYVYQQVYDEAGNPIEGQFVDRDGDGVIGLGDRYVYKHHAADVLMGMTNKFLYKNWDFSFTLRASLNNYLYNDFLSNKCNGANVYANSAWSNTTPDAIALGFTGKSDYYMSDYFVQNASFLKCDNITLGYSFNNLFRCGNYNGINGRIYALVQNPFVITNYKGIDPENNSGVDGSVYPRPRTYMLGLSLNF